MPYKPSRRLAIALPILSVIAFTFTGLALIMSAALQTEPLASTLLHWNPRYSVAMNALHMLQNRKYPLRVGPQTTEKVGIMKITDPGWSVMLDFIQSDIAIRKSERNLPPSRNSSSTEPKTGAAANTASGSSATIPRSDFDRAKTIIALRLDVASAGDQPLAPPYRLILVSPKSSPPGFTAHRVYEFLSFEEFRLDLRRLILGEMEGWSLWLAVTGFGCTVLIEGLRWATAGAERRQLIGEVVGEVTATLSANRQPADAITPEAEPKAERV